jgi:hypothetical protein
MRSKYAESRAGGIRGLCDIFGWGFFVLFGDLLDSMVNIADI